MPLVRVFNTICVKIGTSVLLVIYLLSSFATASETIKVTHEIVHLNSWPGGSLRLYINRPHALQANLPVVIVIPGAKRNAEEYSQYWQPLARSLPMITVTIECDLKQCPSEYHYNLGGHKLQDGSSPEPSTQFFDVPELAFTEIKQKYQLDTSGFYLFGHSAGGTFAHLYELVRPQAPVIHVVAANPAFFVLPDPTIAYPFGIKNSGFTEKQITDWLHKPTLLMLGDLDLEPRTKALSNSPFAQQQGLAVFSRGLQFFARTTDWNIKQKQKPGWQLVIAHGVGHDAEAMAPYAFAHWFRTPKNKK